jgi:hypothetical protein
MRVHGLKWTLPSTTAAAAFVGKGGHHSVIAKRQLMNQSGHFQRRKIDGRSWRSGKPIRL